MLGQNLVSGLMKGWNVRGEDKHENRVNLMGLVTLCRHHKVINYTTLKRGDNKVSQVVTKSRTVVFDGPIKKTIK